MFLSGKALLIYKTKRIAVAIQAIIITTTAIFVIGGLMVAL